MAEVVRVVTGRNWKIVEIAPMKSVKFAFFARFIGKNKKGKIYVISRDLFNEEFTPAMGIFLRLCRHTRLLKNREVVPPPPFVD